MLHKTKLAALAITLLGASAISASAQTNPPRDLSNQNQAQQSRSEQDARDNNYDRSRDMFCRRDAAARTGYTSPGAAADREQTNGSIGGTLGGAALGAIIGGANGNAGAGAVIGAGAGLLAGTAIGSSNAHRAAADVERDYSDAYYACMDEASAGPDNRYATSNSQYGDRRYDDRRYDDRYDYDYAPPPVYYAPPPAYYGYPYPYPYYRPYYGPSVGFSFGFGGGGHRRGHR